MRIVIVGGGQIGQGLAKALAPDHEVFVIDHDPAVGDVFQSMDVEFIEGGGTSDDVLRQADIEHADFFVAATGLDEVNVVACAMANHLGHPQTICLVSRDDFVEGDGGSALLQFGINRVIWPEAQLAADIERTVTAPGAIDAEVFAGGVVRLLEYKLDAASPGARSSSRSSADGRSSSRAVIRSSSAATRSSSWARPRRWTRSRP
jgi:trk system potassium uptake protein TrkA